MESEQFGSYRIEGLIGRGGMGEVYRAFDTDHDRLVALKVLSPALASDHGYRERFRREAHLVARLNEPHVIPIHRYGEIDGRLFLDMRLVRGQDVAAVLAREGRLSPTRAVSIVGQVAAALDAAHADGLVHRDVKPSNILLTGTGDDEFVYLVDFGIARSGADTRGPALTSTGAAVGSFDYMAPERFLEQPIDQRVDVYALACVLHECLTGQRPYGGDGLATIMYAHLNAPPPRPSAFRHDVPPGLDEVVARGLAKARDARYRSAGELATAARQALRTAGVRPLPESAPPAPWRAPEPGPPFGYGPPSDPGPPGRVHGPTSQPGPPGGAYGPPSDPGPRTGQPLPAGTGGGWASGPGRPAPGQPAPAYGRPAFGPPPGPALPFAPSAPAARPRRSPAVVVAAVTALVVALMVVVAVLVDRAGTPSAADPTDPTTATDADVEELQGLLPAAFSPQECTPRSPVDGERAALDCGGAAGGGPDDSAFALYTGQDALDAAFEDVVDDRSLDEYTGAESCADGEEGWTTWHRATDPDTPLGLVTCYVAPSGDTTISWTDDEHGTAGTVRATDGGSDGIADLWDWWASDTNTDFG